jgi:hypothetical protein
LGGGGGALLNAYLEERRVRIPFLYVFQKLKIKF